MDINFQKKRTLPPGDDNFDMVREVITINLLNAYISLTESFG